MRFLQQVALVIYMLTCLFCVSNYDIILKTVNSYYNHNREVGVRSVKRGGRAVAGNLSNRGQIESR